jgi:DNA polymerase III epsilon subunit-like protein
MTEDLRYIVGDTETTGLSASAGACEIAMLEVDKDLNVIHTWETLINPGVPIEPGAGAIHGIKDEDVAAAPTMAAAMNFIFPEGKPRVVLIAHNARFDLRFFGPHMEVVASLCTLEMARKFLPKAPNHRLGTLKTFLNLPSQPEHEALGDILTVLDLLKAIVPLSGRTLDQLVGGAAKPSMLYEMPFGEHKGKPIAEIDSDYRNWLIQQDISADLRYTLETLRKARL